MDSQKILKDINKKSFITLLDDIQQLISCKGANIDCAEICKILRSLYQAIVPSSADLDGDNDKKIMFDLIPAINLCIDHAQNSYVLVDLVKHQFFPIFYHIIKSFLKAELYKPALSFGSIFRTLIDNPENCFEEKGSIVKNLNILFWNDALHVEKNSHLANPDTALELRTASLELLFLDKISLQSIGEKVKLTVIRYCQNNTDINCEKLLNFLQLMWSQLENFSDSYDDKAYLFKLLLVLHEVLQKYLKDFSFLNLFLEWYHNLMDSCSKIKNQKVLSMCSGISKLTIQFFALQQSETNFKKICNQYISFTKNIKNWNELDIEILSTTCSLIYSSFVKCFQPKRNLEDDKILKFIQTNLKICILLTGNFLDMFSEELVRKHLSLPTYINFSTCHIMVNLFLTLLKKEQNELKKRGLISEAIEFLKHSFSNMLPVFATEAGKTVIGCASCITRIGMTLYASNMYSECIYFFEVGDSIFSLCSSLPDYKSEETQVTLWKLHEVLIYALLFSGFHERALKTIVKSLTIHKNKVKECFDLWRKVKRDAIQNGLDTVASKIVSDFLDVPSSEICPESETTYLVEEFKICKSERCNSHEEIISVCHKLLNMPCSSSVRAYLFQEILTLPSTLSDKICENLKKSLTEICLEAICLYENFLAESPDNSAKLYLSCAYFWLYHNKLKEIHAIAEKEAQNILKPATPKPTAGVQNDVEDENDTCDIQPVHPLISISIEKETFKYLDLAVKLWNDLSEEDWKEIAHTATEKNILDIIVASAETYSVALHDTKELKLWILLKSVSISVGSKYHELLACISLMNLLMRLGYLNMASYFMKIVENQAECFKRNEFEILELKFHLAQSNYFLHTAKFDDGLIILQGILASPVLQKKFKSVKMIHAETMMLISEYLTLPSKAYKNSGSKGFIADCSPLSSLMDSVSLCKALLKHFSERQVSCATGLDWLCFKPVLIKNCLKAHVQLGENYFKAGDPRFARCYLQEALKMAESEILTYWSSKILLDLGHIDLLCDNFKDCLVKANGLKYILEKDAKVNYKDILNQMQTVYSTSSSDQPLSPESPDALILTAVPDITLPRRIKQTFIDKIAVMSSPISNKHLKSKKGNHCNFKEENFSMNLIQLESSLLFYLLSQAESKEKNVDDTLDELLNSYSHLKNSKHISDILKSVQINCEVKDPTFRLQSKFEILIYISIQLQKLEFYCSKEDNVSARETLVKAFSFLERATNCPSYLYSDIYSLLKYHDIRVSLCDHYKLPLNSSIAHYICPSIKLGKSVRKVAHLEKPNLEKTPCTPVNRKIPKIVISDYKHETKKCKAPLKKNLLNTNLKKDLESKISDQKSPFIVFSSSEEENFESPYNSLTRASKTRPRLRTLDQKSDKSVNDSKDITYKFFKGKNNTSEVKGASDIWNLCLTDTPKSGKEKMRLQSAKPIKPTRAKTSQVSKKKNQSANSASENLPKTSKSRLKKSKASESSVSTDKHADQLKEIETMSSCLSEMPLEQCRGSPLPNLNGIQTFSKKSYEDSPFKFLEDTTSENVFYTPKKNIPNVKVPDLIDDLCSSLSSLNLSKSTSSHITVGNLEEVIEELNELRLLIENSMPYPLYANICKLLAVLLLVKRDGSWNNEKLLESSFISSEAFSVSLRNVFLGNMTYFKEPEIIQQKEIIIRTMKSLSDVKHQMESFLQIIPEKWTIVQVSAFHNKEYLSSSDMHPCPTKLIISQFRRSSAPVVVSTNASTNERLPSGFLVEFEKILEESALTMLNNDTKGWWSTRSALDIRLKELTRDMENMWLGCWKGLFLGLPQKEERIKQIQSTVEAINRTSPCSNESLLQILVDSAKHLSKEQVCHAVCYLWNCSHDEDVHYKLCKNIRKISNALPETERHPVILLLDQMIQDLPWECIPVMKGDPVTRMPSLSILHVKLALLEKQSVLEKGFDASKTYYVLNPGGDLIHSQEYFQHRFENQMSWNGITGKAPTVKEFISGFKEHEFFIYCGHGSGRKYFEGASVDKLRLQSTSILMGCSSGKLRRLGRVLEANGIVLRLLLSGCPSITANLWDVTDKDIDRFTEKLLKLLVPYYDDSQCGKYNVAKAVSLARSACKMGYLVGSAPVVYGFPVFAASS